MGYYNFQEYINSFLPVTVSSVKHSYGSICTLDAGHEKPLDVPTEILTALQKTAEILKVGIDMESRWVTPFFAMLIDQAFWVLRRGESDIMDADCVDYERMQRALDNLSGLQLLEVKELKHRETLGLRFSYGYAMFLHAAESLPERDDDLCVFELNHRETVVSYSQEEGFHKRNSNWSRLFHARMDILPE